MSDYISREAAINAVYEAYAEGESAYDALEKLPAADVQPVVRARWVPNVPMRDLRPRCSACGVLNPTKENFCPTCGARMEES